MKGKGGALDRRSPARWRVLLLCAFSFGLGMLFTDRCVFPSFFLSPLQEPLDLALRFGFWEIGLMGAQRMDFAESRIPFEIWRLKKFLFVANSVPDGLEILAFLD
jgi:hypothetical protein